jgi:hypothetical protein
MGWRIEQMKSITGIRLLIAAAAAAFTTSASAVTLISNMPGNDATQTAGVSTLRGKGMAFTTAAGTPYIINSVDVRLNVPTPATMNPILQLFSDTGANLPGTALHTFTDPVFTTPGINTYTFTGNFLMSASTKYWLVMFAEAGSSTFDWKASSPAQTPTGIATHSGSLFTTNSGSTWTVSTTLTSYSIQATAVPEPATMAALAIGMAAVIRRRKR